VSTETVTIQKLGAQGDGIVNVRDGPIYVPFTLPGETVAIARIKSQGTVMSITTPSPDRQEPLCRHFGPDGVNGTCGGCTLQHVGDATYRAFKRQLVIDALKSKGLTPEVGELVVAQPGERRRVTFAARKTEKEMLVGFNQAESHHLVNIEECPISSAALIARLPAIKAIGAALANSADSFRITVLETLTGLDIAVDGIKKLSDPQRRKAVETVLTLRGIARVSLNGEILVEPLKPMLDFGGVRYRHRPAASHRRRSPPKRRWRRWCLPMSASRSGSPTCSPAPAHSRCGWPAWDACMRWRAKRSRWRRWTTPRATRRG
jgi:23S rRNA (uracil1939-C5)-methyltransferase